VKNSRGKIWKKMWKKIGVEKTWISVEKFGKKMWKKIGVEKTWISVEKCQRGKKRDKFPWKNITYLVV
jgi:hypothetical protein